MNRHPIVLAHGIARFDFLVQHFAEHLPQFGRELLTSSDGLHYFKGIASLLREKGFDVAHSSVSFAAGVERRAQDLKEQIDAVLAARPTARKVHIIGHSMGGLDARHMIVNHGMAEKVASLTTVGTPHNGTSFADWGLANEGDLVIKAVEKVIDLGGFLDLTTESCREFNLSAEASEATNGVVYQVYSASQPQREVFLPLQGSWKIINDAEGENDGLVPVSSQRWCDSLSNGTAPPKTIGHVSFPVPADHLNEIGWWDIDQINAWEWIGSNALERIMRYEESIRAVYLDIANGLVELD